MAIELMRECGLLIDGKWRTTSDRKPVSDKFTGDPVGDVSLASSADVDFAVSSANRAFLHGAPPPYERSEILLRAASLVEENKDTFAATMIAETGFTLSDVANEIERCKQTLQASAEEAKRLVGEVVPISGAPGQQNRIAFTIRQPCGVVLAITPFNSPLNTVTHKIAPAIASGNSVVLKPSTYTPLTAGLLCQVFLEAGLPSTLLSLVHGAGNTVGQALAAHELVRFIAFTGSTSVGLSLQLASGLRRTQMELGSIACTIACADADLGIAMPRVLSASFRKAGQVCTSIQRLYVARSRMDEVKAALLGLVRNAKVGDPRQKDTFVGPMIDQREAERALTWCDDAVSAGAKRLAGGTRERSLMWPTVLANVPSQARVLNEEIFAPVVVMIPFDELETVIADINSMQYGLASGIFTKSIDKAFKAARALRVGSVHINETSSSRVDVMPYGGVKDSGFGHEGPKYAMREMTEERLITLSLEGA
ncbi:MAG: aldehyde dehydrogenase family protein [Candidatus Acidiferrales bacterium]